ncbi:MAG: ferrous iron transport protein A [Thiobacillus sp.]|jgi:Fe2+ transport system protein FeoA|nr:ferrous iron transport protein A [Thiobacillus sp.]
MSPTDHIARVPLSFLLPGVQARVEDIDEAVSPTQREQLVAYGLAPNRPLVVLQQRPMTIVMIDEVELALECSVARHVWVKRR